MITKGKLTWDDGSSLVGYKVEVWDSDTLSGDDFIKRTYTDENGNYSMDHKKRQDPRYFGKKRRKGDFYIKVKKASRKIWQSRVYSNYEPRVLTINHIFDRILENYGINTVYGKVMAKYPNGEISPLSGVKITVIDDDAIFNDNLGSVVTGTNGDFIVSFSNEEAHLPLEVNIEVPAIRIEGTVQSYSICEDGDMVIKPVTDLIAKAYDYNTANSKHFLGESTIETKSRIGGVFSILTYGSRDYPFNATNGSDIFVQLVDKNQQIEVWSSEKHWNVSSPTVIDINDGNPIVVNVECEDEEEIPSPGGEGTSVTLLNESDGVRYIYKNNVHIDTIPVSGQTTLLVECGQTIILEAKEELSDTLNAVTFSAIVPGLCYSVPIEVTYIIEA